MVTNYHEFAINYAMDDIHNNIINSTDAIKSNGY